MTILSVVQNVALTVGIERPDVVMTSDDREMQEMRRVANQVARRIRDAEFDWQALQVIKTITGDGVTSAFDLPPDYARMTTKAGLWSSRWTWGMSQVSSTDEWLEMLATGFVPVTGQWAIFGDKLNILPALSVTDMVRFVYITNLIVRSKTGAYQESFVADDDTFRLSENALELGMIWLWRDSKGQASDDDETSFNRALYTAMNNDKGSKPIVSGNGRRASRSAKTAFPYRVGG